ncbi:sugar-phosphatase [Pectobacterium polonicum]|uniref:Sugar-phosphatase n=1 Tax=Pectobacterium polonicum TaxID=2485124 RepID=A0AAE9T1K8_9GAMM|nr:sugar-phosphatase [Pectobacterium polonicum]MDC9821725.1 sugar-phosphatase [Pectobacterium polonicum]TKY81153.1 sugar-phosphatase [Pectobacterium polonicum]UVO08452.1 sugar-phosphatase [Pectobacterium polonicum]GKW24734.1 sugar-phosphatase [Pectobacterium carotovorum subsp. carotovorum]
MSVKLIAIDMDGTLLTPQNQISPAVKAAIAAAREKGVQVVLATGRPYIGVERYLMELDLQQEGCYCITNNGALVQRTVNGECVAQTALSFDDYRYFEALACKLGVHFHALDFNFVYTANKDISPYTIHESHLTGMPLKYRAVEEMDRSLTFPKVMMIDEPEILDRAISQLPAEAFERYTIMKSAEYYLEILDKRVNKGEGVKMLAEHLGIPRESVMTLGDQQNDLAMIRYAGIGVAMGNAIDEVKEASQFVTKTNMEDGVAYAIEKFVLNA